VSWFVGELSSKHFAVCHCFNLVPTQTTMFVFGVSLLRQLKFSSRNGVQKHSHQHTFRVHDSCSIPYLGL